MKRIKLIKNYPIRHDIIILASKDNPVEMEVGPDRAFQLHQGGFTEVATEKPDMKVKSKRVNKEEKPTIVEHKIKE